DDEAQDYDDQEDEGNDEDDEEEGSDDGQASDEEEFIHPSLSTHAEEETEDEESFDPISKTPENTDDEGNGEENLGTNSSSVSSQFVTMAPLPMFAPTLTPSTIATITTTQQAPTPPTTTPSTLLQDLPNFSSLFGFDHRLKTLEANFSEFMQTNQFAGAVSFIPGIVQRYMDQRMNEAVKVKEQVKVQVSKILPKIEQTVNEQLKAEVLTRLSNSSKTSYVVVADLFEMELKKILIEKMEGNKSIHRSNEQRNLYKALVEAYESDKIILDTYGDTVTLKRRRDDDADKDEEPSAGSDRGSKRRREGKEPESASAQKEKATRSAGKSTQGSKSRQTSTSESATAEEPIDDEDNGEENLRTNVGRDEGQDEEDEADELYRDVNINLGRGIQLGDVHTAQEVKDSHVTLTPVNPDGMESIFETTLQMDVQTPTSVAPLLVSPPTITPSTIATVTIIQQTPTLPTTAPSTLLQYLPNFGWLFGFDHLLKTLKENFFEFTQMNQFSGAVSSIPEITIDENMQKIIKEQVKEQVKVQVSKILPKIEQTVNEQLEAEVLNRSSNSSKTSYAVATDLSEMELKKILIEKMEGNKSIHRSNEQRNLYKALVEAYKSYKIIFDTYEDTVTLKRGRDDDADKDEEPSVGSDRGSAGKSTQGSKSRQTSTSESATAEEPMQTTFEMEEPSYPEFETPGDDQPIVKSSQHHEWFSQQKKPSTPDHAWNKILPATHGSIQPVDKRTHE
nr:hypothetical protein [Tanacetum cinerariifolium]